MHGVATIPLSSRKHIIRYCERNYTVSSSKFMVFAPLERLTYTHSAGAIIIQSAARFILFAAALRKVLRVSH